MNYVIETRTIFPFTRYGMLAYCWHISTNTLPSAPGYCMTKIQQNPACSITAIRTGRALFKKIVNCFYAISSVCFLRRM